MSQNSSFSLQLFAICNKKYLISEIFLTDKLFISAPRKVWGIFQLVQNKSWSFIFFYWRTVPQNSSEIFEYILTSLLLVFFFFRPILRKSSRNWSRVQWWRNRGLRKRWPRPSGTLPSTTFWLEIIYFLYSHFKIYFTFES